MRLVTLAALGILSLSSLAHAQDSLPIELGTSQRVGGRGVTEEAQARYDAAYAPEEPLTEANLPPPGHRKRFESLHELAERNAGGRQWKDACRFYDLIIEEGGMDAINARERGRVEAARSYLGCASNAHRKGEFDAAEALISKSVEVQGTTSSRHEALQWKIYRDQLRRKMTNGDAEGALTLYGKLSNIREDEDERIWLGEQLAEAAWAAHEEGDEIRRDTLMSHLETLAPQNTRYRALLDQMALGGEVLRSVAIYGLGGIALVTIFGLFTSWRSRARVGAAGKTRNKNKFIDEEDELV